MPLDNTLRGIASELFRCAATPRALTCELLVRYGEWDQLVNLTVDPRHYDSADLLRRDLACTEFLRKLEDLDTSVDREAAAHESFWAAEQQCYCTNQRMLALLKPLHSDKEVDERVWKFISRVKKDIHRILGPAPHSWEGRFGPGATYADKGKFTTIPDKMSSSPTFTPDAWPYLINWAGTAWARALPHLDDKRPTSVQGNRFTTVPKDATKHRGICVEPSINSFYQLGLGREIRRRLKQNAGIDLKYGQDLHRRVACEASLNGSSATIDLSNASDTVAYNLVKLLLPHDWFEILASLRSPYTLVKDQWVRLEKFSSMGNGFTFELETLVFLAIARACCPEYYWDGGVMSYGDDIIVPVEHAGDVVAALRFFGFTPNPRKTYVEGWFKESCGGDFFKGSPVRAHYVKETPNEPQQLITLANGLRALGLRDSPGNPGLSWTFSAWLRTLDAIPSAIRLCRGPTELGDIVIHDEPSRWASRVRNSIRYLRAYKPVQRYTGWSKWHPEVCYAAALYGGGESKGVIPRNSVRGYKCGWVHHS